VWPRFSAQVKTGAGAHPASYAMGTGSLSREKKRPGRGDDHPPLLAPRLKKVYSYILYSHSGPFVACSGVKFYIFDRMELSFSFFVEYCVEINSKLLIHITVPATLLIFES
jgi:hypothetical protein